MWLSGKESVCQAGDLGSIPGSGKSPREGNGSPVFLPGKSYGQRSLEGYSPWGCKELDTTEQLILSFFTFNFEYIYTQSISKKKKKSTIAQLNNIHLNL